MRDGKVIKTEEGIMKKIREFKRPFILPGGIPFGERFFGQVFVPETATVQQLNAVMFAAKGHYNFEHDAIDGEGTPGITFVFWIKPDHINLMTEELLAADAGVYDVPDLARQWAL